MIELLAPAGNIDCLKAAIQNGANSVYFGGPLLNARASASNFSIPLLKEAISYAKLRNVKTYLTLNTIVQPSEFEQAIHLALQAYEYGIDSIIVQDLGLGKTLIKELPDLPIHGSTQMSIHNLEGALTLQKLGFKRVVLARELSLSEIQHITKNCSIETECFVHGALCISYSGQCLFSSMIGGRSGNRGKCAQPCRLPYSLQYTTKNKSKTIRKGHLLSPYDLCGLPYIPEFISSGVSCLKIEGRMKPVDYVATVTRIYRTYINLAQNDPENYRIKDQDQKELLQVFNRGGFSSGHLLQTPNRELVYPEKPNNMGLYLGNISYYNKEKGLITLSVKEPICIGDSISIQGETKLYTISELMTRYQNITSASINHTVQIGRMKGNIKVGYKVFKMKQKSLSLKAEKSILSEQIKIPLYAKIIIKKGIPITLTIKALQSNYPNYKDLQVTVKSSTIPEQSIKSPITKDRICKQLQKTTETPYKFDFIETILEDDIYIPHISAINELRRNAIKQLESLVIKSQQRRTHTFSTEPILPSYAKCCPSISVLLNKLDPSYKYNELKLIDSVYIPLGYFLDKKYESIVSQLTKQFHTYVYFPTIMKSNIRSLLLNKLDSKLSHFYIKGFVISNLADLSLIERYQRNYEWISNFTFNVTNVRTISTLYDLGINRVTLSPELNMQTIKLLTSYSPNNIEVLAYGRLPIMNMSYCLLGKTNQCYPTCPMFCTQDKNYNLKDRYGAIFPIIADPIQTVTTIYHNQITSLPFENLPTTNLRISIFDEDISEINKIINSIRNKKSLIGDAYTTSNYYRDI